jgi:hypothetical protein
LAEEPGAYASQVVIINAMPRPMHVQGALI